MMKHLHHPNRGLSIVLSHAGVGPPTCGLNPAWTPLTLLPHLGCRCHSRRLAWESLAQQREGVYIAGRAASTVAVSTEAVSKHGENTREHKGPSQHQSTPPLVSAGFPVTPEGQWTDGNDCGCGSNSWKAAVWSRNEFWTFQKGRLGKYVTSKVKVFSILILLIRAKVCVIATVQA